MPAPEIIHQLVARFAENRAAYRSGKYNEAQLRQQFLDPFFEALGWDIYNRNGVSPEYQDVKIEDSLQIEGALKAPDYAFKIGKERKFYVEAKKPAVDIQYGIHPAYQLKRYAWNAHLPLSILTDFEEFAVYNCKNKPNPDDSAATGRDLFYRYTDYIEKWDEIAAIFSRDAVWKGSFDRFAESSKGKKGTTEVDDAILESIESWRKLLALNIALRNPQVADEHQLNYAVQMTIDRILFLRICEDRGIEPEEQFKNMTARPGIYAQMVELFRRADMKYNSGLFHFSKEKGSDSAADSLTPGLKIDDKVLKEIINSIYYPCPYIFKEIPVEILGQVYEQFLGKVIRLTAGHQAKVEEKPEVRKAGGVYYTPKYIVDYIVENTVGKMLEGKTPTEAAELKIVDPACGSGSFLLGAYQHLLDWHEQWYTGNDPEKWAKGKNPALVAANGGGWKLTTAKKKEILVNNIHGVDIDAQAVEVTKLSLLLKVLEEETGQLSLGLERVLPDLGRNIQCGNSLIGPDYFAAEQMTMFDNEERYRINAFDWQTAFPLVFQKGGFDAVIGNPPYIRIQAMKEWAPAEVEFYKKWYRAAGKGNYDIYVVFVEKGLSLLNQFGRLGFILPHKFFNAQYGESLRKLISTGNHLAKVVHFGDQQVFEGATTYTCLMFLENIQNENFDFEKVTDLKAWQSEERNTPCKINADSLLDTKWNFVVGSDSLLFEKLKLMPSKLGNFADRMAQGIRTSANEIYVVDYLSKNEQVYNVTSKQLNHEVKIESHITKQFLQGREIKRYRILHSGKLVIIPYTVNNKKSSLIPIKELKEKFPLTFEYLQINKKFLEDREHGKMKGSSWYAYVYPKNLEVMTLPKILVPDIADKGQFALDENGDYSFTSGYGITLKNETQISIKYVLGLLNSKLLDFYLKRISTPMRGGFFRYFTSFIETLPIYAIDFSNPADVKRHDRMVALVERMLDLHKRTPATPQEQERLTRDIASTDREIDKLVYELYGLSDEEIKIVEGN